MCNQAHYMPHFFVPPTYSISFRHGPLSVPYRCSHFCGTTDTHVPPLFQLRIQTAPSIFPIYLYLFNYIITSDEGLSPKRRYFKF